MLEFRLNQTLKSATSPKILATVELEVLDQAPTTVGAIKIAAPCDPVLRFPLWILIAFLAFAACTEKRIHNEIIIVGPQSALAWPMYIAKEGGYYTKNGLNVRLVVANHPADIAMLTSGEAQVDLNTLQNAMRISARDDSFTILANPLRKLLFALVGGKGIKTAAELKGKRIGITQLGGNTYNYSVMLLAEFGITPSQVQWIPMGDSERAGALMGGYIDATAFSAPSYFALEAAGLRSLANISDFDDIVTANVLLLGKNTIASNPMLPELLIRTHAEAVKRFYEDKAFAVHAYYAYNRNQEISDIEKVYDRYASKNALSRIPYLTMQEVQYVLAHESDTDIAKRMKDVNVKGLIDNDTVGRLVRDGFFAKLFDPKVSALSSSQ